MKSKRIQSGRRFLALDIDDIPGARPRATKATKNFSHYEKQLSGDLSPFMDSIEKQKNLFGNHQTIFGSGQQKQNYQEAKSGKRHYIKHWDSEIGEDNVIKRRDDQRNSKIEIFDYPRNLVTDDIPGATAGTLKNKALKNHNLAGTLRQSASSTKIRPSPPVVQRNQSQDESLDRYSFRIPPKKEEKYDYSHSFNPALGRISSLQNLLKRQRLSEIVSQNGFEEKPPQQNDDSRHQRYPFPYDFKYGIEEFPDHAGLPSKPSHMLGKRHSSVPHFRNREVILPDYEGSLQRDVWENSNQRESSPQYERYEEFPPVNQYHMQNHNKPKVENLMATPEPTKTSLKKISVFNIISNQANTKEIPAQAKLPHRYGIEWGPGGQPRRGLQNIASQRVQQNFEHIDALDRLRLPELHQNQNNFYRDSPDYQNPTRQRSREPNNYHYHYQHHNY